MARESSSSAGPPPASVDHQYFFITHDSCSFHAVQCPGEDDSAAEGSIKQACLEALKAVKVGLLKKSTKIMKKAIDQHPNSATLYRTLAFVHLMSTLSSCHPPNEVKLVEKSMEAAKKSLAISPNQISLILLYNQVLFDWAKDREDYERIGSQCQQALLIQDPIDPKNSIIVNPKDKLIEGPATKESRIEDVKRELKRLIQKAKKRVLLRSEESKEEERKVFTPADEFLQTLIEERKRQESIRKELDLQIKMVRDQQAQLYSGSFRGVDDKRRSKKTNKASQVVSKLDRKALVLDYWRHLSGEEKSGFLHINLDEVKMYYSTSESAMSVLKEALDFGKSCQKWKYWHCSSSGCTEFFIEYDFWIDHVVKEHIGDLSQKEKELSPSPSNDACIYKIKKCAWKPVDANEMLKIVVATESDEKLKDNIIYANEDKWPFCEDAEREDLLKNIKRLLNLLLSNRCLSQSIVIFLIEFTRHFSPVRKLWHLIPDLKKNPLSICLSGSQQLLTIYEWLDEISRCCQLVELPESGIPSGEVYIDQECEERIAFTNEFSRLSLDERLMGGESDDFVRWLYDGDEIGQLVESWAGLRVYRMEIAEQVLRYLDSEFKHLQNLCAEKCFWVQYDKAFAAVKGTCIEEGRKKQRIPGYIPQSYMHLLFNMRNELAGSEEGDGAFQRRVVFDILKTVEMYCKMQFGSEDALISVNTQLSDLKAADDDEQSRIENQLAVAEAFVRQSSDSKIFDVLKQECKVDALMMKSQAAMDTGRMLGLQSAHDFLPIMLHLLKSFVRSHLEKFAGKEAEKRAETAKEELMSEIACYPDKNTDAGHDKNKKSKNNRNTKQKTISRRQEHQSLNKKNKEIRFRTISTGYNPGLVISDGSVNWEEGATSIQMSYDEMIELEKNLEYQRKFEDEAKKKRLLEKNKNMSETPPLNMEDQLLRLLSKSEGMDTEELRDQQRAIENDIEQKPVAEQNKQMGETSTENVENDMLLVSKPADAEKYSMPEAPRNSQAVTSAGKSIHIDVPFMPKPNWPSVHDNQLKDLSMKISFGSKDCKNLLPAEAYSEPGETNVPTEHKQVEKSGQITLSGAGNVEVGDSLSQAGNVGLDDTGNVSKEEEKNVPDLEGGVHNLDLDAFNDPDVVTMDEVLPYCRIFNPKNIKGSKEFKSYVYKHRGYSSA